MSGDACRIAVKVADIEAVTPLVKRFRLEPLGGSLPRFGGGAHVLVEIPDETGARRNAYSLMSPPSQQSYYSISVRREEKGRGGSRHLHDKIGKGSVLSISEPVNLFPIEQRARKHLMFAGGIGITPFLAMLDDLHRRSAAFELHYAARSHDHAAFADELEGRYRTHVAVYRGDGRQRLQLEQILAHQPLGTHLYVCGPEGMITSVLGAARAAGWPERSLHFERFTAPTSGRAFDVRLARSGRVVRVEARQSLLEAIEAAGVKAPSLCRGGACGQCETAVKQCVGTLLHYDHFLSEEQKSAGMSIMPCVSRFEGSLLVLDI